MFPKRLINPPKFCGLDSKNLCYTFQHVYYYYYYYMIIIRRLPFSRSAQFYKLIIFYSSFFVWIITMHIKMSHLANLDVSLEPLKKRGTCDHVGCKDNSQKDEPRVVFGEASAHAHPRWTLMSLGLGIPYFFPTTGNIAGFSNLRYAQTPRKFSYAISVRELLRSKPRWVIHRAVSGASSARRSRGSRPPA